MEFLDIVADWSERHDIPYELFRDDDMVWCVALRFKDSRGWFVSDRLKVKFPKQSNQGDAAKVSADFREAVNKRLGLAALSARRERTKLLTKCDPRRNRAA